MRCRVACLLAIAVHPRIASADDTKLECISAATEGQTLRADGKLLEAREQIRMCARDVCPAIVKSHCARWLGELDERIPSVVVRAQDSGGGDLLDARIAIDRNAAKLDGHPVELDPGDHLVALDTASGVHIEGRVLLVEGEKARVLVLQVPVAPAQETVRTIASGAAPLPVAAAPFEHAAASPSRESFRVPIGAWVLGAVAVASAGSAVYFGVQAQSVVDSLKRPPSEGGCSPFCTAAQTGPGRTDAAWMYASIGVGGAALGGSVLWALLANAGPATRRASFALRASPIAGGALATLATSY
jgi:hypothetical protein